MVTLLDGQSVQTRGAGLSIEDVAVRLAVGGWPGFWHLPAQAAGRMLRGYLRQVYDVDVQRTSGWGHEPAKVARVIRSLAHNSATEVSIATLAADAELPDGRMSGQGLSRNTVAAYLDALGRLMIVEDQPAWSTHLRSKARLRQAPKRHFVDPSLAVAALDASPQRLLADMAFFGQLSNLS